MTKLQPLIIANTIRAMFVPCIIALEAQAAYWKTWESVYRPRGKGE